MAESMGAESSTTGRLIRARRRQLNLTQARLGQLLGVRPIVVGRWERDEAVPGPDQLDQLAESLALERDVLAAGLAVPVRLVGGRVRPADPFRGRGVDREALVVDRSGGSSSIRDRFSALVARLRPARGERRAASIAPGRSRAEPGLMSESDFVRESQLYGSVLPVPAGIGATRAEMRPVPVHWERDPRQRARYALRRVFTAGALIALAIMLWWAVGEFWDGWGAVVDLFRSDPEGPVLDGIESVTG